MSGLENNPPFRGRNPDNDITFNIDDKTYAIPDRTFIKAGKEFLSLCKMCKKSPLTCENDFIKEIEVPMEPGDAPELEVIGKVRLPSGEMSEEKGLGFKLADGVKTGFYKTEEDIPDVWICQTFDPKDSG